MYTSPVTISRSHTISSGACQRAPGIQRNRMTSKIAKVYQSTISGRKYLVGTNNCVKSRRTRTMPSRKVISRKRTRVNHCSQPTTFWENSIRDKLYFCEAPKRTDSSRQDVPIDCGRQPEASRSANFAARKSSFLVAAQLADQREQRQGHGDDDAADYHAAKHDHHPLHCRQEILDRPIPLT